MKTRAWQTADGGWNPRSILECGSRRSATPISDATGSGEKLRRRCALPEQSTTWRLAVLLGFILLHSSFCLRAWGQSYTIDWHQIAGGGGTSTGGVYSVSGTLGQPDVSGVMTGGNYALAGGFWSLYAVQTAGAPVLGIQLLTTNTAMVYWPSPSAGFNLQVSTNLATTNWVTPAETVTDNGTNKYILVNPPTGNEFYRLRSP